MPTNSNGLRIGKGKGLRGNTKTPVSPGESVISERHWGLMCGHGQGMTHASEQAMIHALGLTDKRAAEAGR